MLTKISNSIRMLQGYTSHFILLVYKLASQCSVKRLGLIAFLIAFLTFLPTVLYLMTIKIGSHDREKFYSAIDLADNRSQTANIPKIVHQIWIGSRQPPPHFMKCALNWQSLTSHGYQYRLWNMTSLKVFFQTRHKYYLSRWLNFKYTMNRVDTAKHFLMYSFGGLYIDMDICNTQKDPIGLLQSKKYLGNVPGRRVLLQEALPSGVNPEIMMAPPVHPFFRHCLRSLYDSDRMYVLPYLYMMCVGGPLLLTRAVNSYIMRDNHIFLLPYLKSRSEVFSGISGGEWYTWDSKIIITGIYFGIFHGQIVPYWLSISLLLLIAICGIFKLRRRWNSDRITKR